MRNMMLVCRAWTNGGVDIEETYPVYVVTVDKEQADSWGNKINSTKELWDKDHDMYCVTYWGLPGDFMDLGALDASVEGVQDLIDRMDAGEEMVQVPADSKLAKVLDDAAERVTFDGGARIRTECRKVEVTPDGVVPTAIIKHTSVTLESTEIKLTLLSELRLN